MPNPCRSSTASSTASATSITSTPMPSPGMTAMRRRLSVLISVVRSELSDGSTPPTVPPIYKQRQTEETGNDLHVRPARAPARAPARGAARLCGGENDPHREAVRARVHPVHDHGGPENRREAREERGPRRRGGHVGHLPLERRDERRAHLGEPRLRLPRPSRPRDDLVPHARQHR